jgi:hypothetical protein
VVFVKYFPLRVKGFMLRVDSGGMCLEGDEMRFQLLEILLVTGRAELRTLELFKLLHEFGMRGLEGLLRRGKINRRIGCLGHRFDLTRQRPGKPPKTRRIEKPAAAGISETWDHVRTIRTSRTSTRAKR